MNCLIHKSSERGHANHGWLNSFHSFSFAGFYNPERIHFGALRVLNDDTVAPGYGFGKHPHDNMEIISIPLSGDLHHKDSTGRDMIIRHGDVQIMSAGKGISHSETNASKDREVKFLQIWIFPKEKNIEPRYEQKSFSPAERKNKWQVVVAPDEPGALGINQDAWLTLGDLQSGTSAEYHTRQSGNGLYVFVISGEVEIAGCKLAARDAAGITDAATTPIKAEKDSELLIIEVPMQFND